MKSCGRYLRAWVPLVGLCILLPLAGAQDTPDAPPPLVPHPDFAEQPAQAVLKVSAGNELLIRRSGEETTIRLIGTYVPQSGPAAEDARAFVTRLLWGESVYLEREPVWPERDREGRLWAYVYRAPDGLFLNLELVRQGYARVSAGDSFEHQKLLRAYERIAEKNHKGLWSERPAEAEPPLTSRPTVTPAPEPVARPAPAGEDVIVYVTEHGKRYHRQDCQYVRNGAIALTIKAAKERGCSACARCKPPP